MSEKYVIGVSASGFVTFEPKDGASVVQVAEVIYPEGPGMMKLETVCWAMSKEIAERIVRALHALPPE